MNTGSEQNVRKNKPAKDLERVVAKKSNRKLRSRREGKRSPWFGLGMFGIVGWSIALPTLLGVTFGSWIDVRWPGQVSWKLTFLFIGLAVGCANAWYWIQKETS